ncbi:alpha/beta hydrolase-fold protein [Microbulbifer taiwanensis]
MLSLLALLLAGTLAGCHSGESPGESAGEQERGGQIPLDFLPALYGDYFKLDSRIVGRPYHIYVRFPEGYDETSDRRYPVIYLLDGDSMFPILAANHLFLHYDDQIPEAIVVGVAYGSFDPSINYRDVDFSTVSADRERSGGAKKFHRFLEKELLPEVEDRYLTDPERRILYGQSRGGFMVLYSAFMYPDLFWGRIAGNPSFLPNKEQFFDKPAEATRDDLTLAVASASDDRYQIKITYALDWHDSWKERSNAPWSIRFSTIPGATHAANSTDIYRFGLRQIFAEEIQSARGMAAEEASASAH